MNLRAPILVLAVTCTLTHNAGAAGFANPRIGGEHGHPTTDNATALYFNPGALVLSKGTNLYADGMLGLAHESWEHPAAPSDTPEPPGAEGANTGTAKVFVPVFAPAVGVTTRLGDLALGAGFFAPFGGGGRFKKNDAFDGDTQYPGAVDGVARWFAVEGSQSTTYLVLGAAYKIGRVGIGLTGNLVHSSIDIAYGSTIDGSDSVLLEGRSLLQVSGTNGSLGVGIVYEAVPDKLWVGYSYQAQPGLGKIALQGRLRTTYPGLVQDDQVKLEEELPDVLRAGLRYRPATDLELRLFGDVTRWSVFDQQCVSRKEATCAVNADGGEAKGASVIRNLPRKWHDSLGVRAGASWFTSQRTELFAGLGFDSSAIPDATLDPATPDADKLAGAVGVRLGFGDHVHLAASFTHIQLLSRDTVGKSLRSSAYQAPSKSPDAGGRYAMGLELLDVNAEYRF